MNEKLIHIISLGAGVQSSTMALMAARGELTPMPDFAVFADTQDEPKEVYDYLDYLKPLLPFPVHIATAGKLSDSFDRPHSHIPLFFKSEKGYGLGKRQCTKYYKIVPMYKLIREMGIRKAFIWVGISLDEVSRMKPARVKWATNTWPLIDKRMSRYDCKRWLEKNGFREPPKSACEYCPFHDEGTWRRLKASTSWPRIVAVSRHFEARGEYLHPSCKPIDEVDFSTEEQRGQVNMFNNECEGMCGV